jgi:glycosyltransferase involved in cell wall biosynthesis
MKREAGIRVSQRRKQARLMFARPRLLFLSQCLPWPPHSGVANRTFHILRQLGAAYHIDVVAFSRMNHQADKAARDAARRALGSDNTVVAEPTPIPGERSALRNAWDHVRSVMSGRAYTWYVYQSGAFERQLRSVLRTRSPDLVHLDSLDLHSWLPALPPVPVACTHHDIDSELLRRRAQRLDSAASRRYLMLQAGRVERVERTLAPRFAVNVMMSSLDAALLRARAPEARTTVVPNGTDTEYFRPDTSKPAEGCVAFVGPTFGHPNRDAVEFLLSEIWPKIHAANHRTSLRLIGANAPEDRARYAAQPGVSALGYLSDIRPSIAETCCCVVPIRIGGGTRLKILDAWAMGKAVVSTSVGCEGLAAVDGENILIRDTPEAIAEGVLRITQDDDLRTHLEQNARRTAVELYSWDSSGQTLRRAYEVVLGRPVQAAQVERKLLYSVSS